MSRRNLFLLAIAAMLILAIPATADLKVVQKTHTGAVMGQEQPDQTQTIYATSKWIRQDMNDKMAFIFDGASGKMIMLNFADKTYSTVDMEQVKSMMAMASGMMGEIKVSVTPTQKNAKVGKWNTQIWTLKMTSNMLNIDMDLYATTEITMPTVYDGFSKEMGSLMGPMGKMIEEMQKVKGYPVKTIGKVSVMGQNVETTTEVIEVSTAALPESLFKIPVGFKEVAFNPMSMQGMQ
jgi:hypothetical protein